MQELALPSDQYQRHKMIKEVMETIRAEEPLCILDVDGSPGTLWHYLPSDQLVIADLDASASQYVTIVFVLFGNWQLA